MITYYALPLNTLKKMAEDKGLKIDYHPLLTIIKTSDETSIVSLKPPMLRAKINQMISEYEQEPNQ